MLVELHKRGYSIGLIVFELQGALVDMLPSGVQGYNLGTVSLRDSLLSFLRKLYYLKPKIIFSTFGYINVILLAIRWLLPRGSSIWVREANLPSISLKNNSYSWFMSQAYRWLYPRADRVLCTSLRMQREFVNVFKVPLVKIRLLFNPVDERLIRSKVNKKSIKRDANTICFVASGRLTYQKGFDRLLYWFASLGNKNSRLTILGDGIMEDELRLLADDLDIGDRVSFVGFCDNPWQMYAESDVFLLSSRWEGMPNVALESLACGTPVIATDESGGIYEVAEQAVLNSVTVVSSPASFCKAMESVNPSLADSLRVSLLPDSYKISNVIDDFERLLDEA